MISAKPLQQTFRTPHFVWNLKSCTRSDAQSPLLGGTKQGKPRGLSCQFVPPYRVPPHTILTVGSNREVSHPFSSLCMMSSEGPESKYKCITYRTSKWSLYSVSLSSSWLHAQSAMYTTKPTRTNVFLACYPISLYNMFFIVSVHNYKPCDLPLKRRCSNKGVST